MKRFYLSTDGVPRFPGPGEEGHIAIARAVLGAGWAGDIFATYEAMWNAGWVRVVDTPAKLYGEKLLNRRQVPFSELTPAQQVWFGEKARSDGKQLIWNDQEFANTRETLPGVCTSNPEGSRSP